MINRNTLYICGLLLLVFLLVAIVGRSSQKSWWIEEMSNLKHLGYEVLRYSDATNGALPNSLYELRASLPPEKRYLTYFGDREAGQHYDWLYFNPPIPIPSKEAIIAAAPRPRGGRQRIVLFKDGSASFLDETEFTRALGARER